MQKWRCSICGYTYDPNKGDPESGVDPGVSFEVLADHWGCPDCGASKQLFERSSDDGVDD